MANTTTRAKAQFGLEPEEVEKVREFFTEEILGQSSEHILGVYQKLLV